MPFASSTILAEASFWESLFREPTVAGTLGLAFCFVLLVAIPVVAGAWVKVARARAEAELKKSMIERGMSVEEIENVLRIRSHASQ